jgi:hypothetical protein
MRIEGLARLLFQDWTIARHFQINRVARALEEEGKRKKASSAYSDAKVVD